jgi:hypothetical protein
VIQNDCGRVWQLGMYEWQLCEWGRVDICMTFHKRAFVFFNMSQFFSYLAAFNLSDLF